MRQSKKALAFVAAAAFSASAYANVKTYDASPHAILGGSTAIRGGGSYGTGFETAEGFTVGLLTGQNGWTHFAASATTPTVATANPFAGSQHMRISKSTPPASGTLTGGFSPNLGAQTPGTSYMSVYLNITATQGADYDVVPQAPSQGFLSARVKFNFQGNIFILDDADGPGPGGLGFVDTGFVWGNLANTYMHLEILMDVVNDTMSYKINGNTIYNSVVGPIAGTTFEQVVLLSDNFQNPGETGDFDNLFFSNNVPAPGALALIGLAGLVGSRRRRS